MTTETIETIDRIVRLLKKYSYVEWQSTFERFAKEYPIAPTQTRSAILRTFGGMGSFSDLILQESSGAVPDKDNSELEQLKRTLYHLCKK